MTPADRERLSGFEGPMVDLAMATVLVFPFGGEIPRGRRERAAVVVRASIRASILRELAADLERGIRYQTMTEVARRRSWLRFVRFRLRLPEGETAEPCLWNGKRCDLPCPWPGPCRRASGRSASLTQSRKVRQTAKTVSG